MNLRLNSYKYDGIRKAIFGLLEDIFKHDELLIKSKNGKNVYYTGSAEDTKNLDSLCLLGIVMLDNGILIETSFPRQTGVHNRVWMIDANLGRITYIEVTNPNLVYKLKIVKNELAPEILELHAMPEDLQLLKNLLSKVVIDISNPASAKKYINSFSTDIFNDN